MNKEVSAGGVIVCKTKTGWVVLVMKDLKNHWTFPKGKIEEGENLENTATREIAEEVGVKKLQLIAPLKPTSYWYFRGKPIRKTVHYYLFISKTPQKPVVQTEEGITEAKWAPWKEAEATIGYPKTNRPLLREAQKILADIH
ncbi:NUDIX domain-containing protein [Candidatus Gottesmanbacteria bacterium]|nr:NUDIX domain-containing protein [Candidatus Gottesmanbacteria bacterium]